MSVKHLDDSRGTWNMIRLINRSIYSMYSYWQTFQMSLKNMNGNHFTVQPRKVYEGVSPTVRHKNHFEKTPEVLKSPQMRNKDRHKHSSTQSKGSDSWLWPCLLLSTIESSLTAKSPAEDMSTESSRDWKTTWGSVHLHWPSSSGFRTHLVELILCITWCFFL